MPTVEEGDANNDSIDEEQYGNPDKLSEKGRERIKEQVDNALSAGAEKAEVFVETDAIFIVCKVSMMAEEIERRFPELNVMLCNCGVLFPRRLETKDGFESTFQVNYLAHYLLSNLLIPILTQNHANIIMIGSVLHTWPSLDWSDVMAEKDYEKYLQYSRSKLMCHLLAFALHRRMNIARQPVNVNIIELGKEKEPNNNGKLRTTSALSSSMSTLSICRQAGNLAQLIEGPCLEKISGKYLDPNGKQMRSGSEATDERLQEKLWTYSKELCEKYL
ncbi:unnamed protein product [Caenorhabditis angaria]|uniref:Uncharacterized protein n=1 Tax=Caenorhabditis angaria TaxID=860376 RepID=A0A9P1N807_9PELO|nr:unnamed protein product [Caenorhabditis angaria]